MFKKNVGNVKEQRKKIMSDVREKRNANLLTGSMGSKEKNSRHSSFEELEERERERERENEKQ